MILDPEIKDIHLGPIMVPEQKLLQAICDLTDPKVIVEFGFFTGFSSRSMLEFVDEDAKIYSFDYLDRSEWKINDKRHTLYTKDMKQVTDEDIPGMIDVVFFDASHVLEDTVVAYNRIKHKLKPGSIIVVHDTGAYDKDVFNPDEIPIKKIVGQYVYHCPDEHTFIQMLKDEGYNCINFTATTKVRHGIAVLQKEFDFARRVQ
jgi:hypothetical protein